MRVLHVNDYLEQGGCEVIMHDTIDALRERGVEVDCFTGDAHAAKPGGPFSYVDSRSMRRRLRDAVEAFAPDVVHLHNYYHLLSPGILATLDAMRRHRPLRVVMTAHDFHLLCPNAGCRYFRNGVAYLVEPERLDSLRYLFTRRWDHRGALHSWMKLAQHLWNYRLQNRRRILDLVLCPSRFTLGLMERIGVPTALVPNPVPAPQPPVPKPSGRLRFVFAGRLEPEKGLVPFLEMLPETFDGLVTIIGDGSEKDACRAVAARRGLEVEFPGWRDRAWTIDAIARGHVVFLPSLLYENAPTVLFEAISRGTNVLVSDLGGMREVVDETGIGFTFVPNDRDSLARRLEEIQSARDAGSLNGFDPQRVLEPRSRRAYVDRLLAHYTGASLDGPSAPA